MNLKVVNIHTNDVVGHDGVSHPYMSNLPAFAASRSYVTNASLTFDASGHSAILGTYDSIAYNHNNAFNASTGVFTAPVSGLYQISLTVNVLHDTLQYCNIALKKNTGSLYPVYVARRATWVGAADAWMGGNVSGAYPLIEGESVGTWLSFSNVVSQTLTSVSIMHSMSGFLIKRL